MKAKSRNVLLSLGVIFAVAVTAHANGLVALSGDLNQTRFVSGTCNGSVCRSVFEGSGTVNIMGHVTWTAHTVQDFSGFPCNTATAEITLVGATGSITISDSCGTVCPSATVNGAPFTIDSVWNVIGGTGQFSGIIGSGTNQGTIGGQGPNIRLSGIVVF